MHQTKSYLVEAACPAGGAGTGAWGENKDKTTSIYSCSLQQWWVSSFLPVANQSPLSKSFMDSFWHRSIIATKTSVSLATFSPDTAQAHGWLVATVQFPRLSKSSPGLAALHPYRQCFDEGWRADNLTCFPMMCHPKSGFGTASLSFGSNEITT